MTYQQRPIGENVIYIIESDGSLHRTISYPLAAEGYTTEILSESDVEKSVKDSPANVIVFELKDADGYDRLRAIHKACPQTPIIVLSRTNEVVEIDRLLHCGAEDYIIKDEVTPYEVGAKIRRLLAKHSITSPILMDRTTSLNDTLPPLDTTNIRVLIVEDDQFLRDLSSRKLKQEGFKVDVALDGNEGFKKIVETKPDIVLLDIILPGMDGFEILKQVRAHKVEQIRNSAVILLSNLGQESDVAKGERLGADDYLIKSNFTIDEIIEKIRVVIQKKKNSGRV